MVDFFPHFFSLVNLAGTAVSVLDRRRSMFINNVSLTLADLEQKHTGPSWLKMTKSPLCMSSHLMVTK